jgi:integron integrase
MNEPRLLDQVRLSIRRKHYSPRAEQSYVYWIRQYIRYHRMRQPLEMHEQELKQFLDYLANTRKVAASTRNQALCAILYLYRDVLEAPLGQVTDVNRARRPEFLPVVLSRDEAERILQQLEGDYRLLASLLYGTGMRVSERLGLRVADIDFEYAQITVCQGKGSMDRITRPPERLRAPLQNHISGVRPLHERDIEAGFGHTWLPYALERKYPDADREWIWQFVFPSATRSTDRSDGVIRRFHMSPRTIQHAMRSAECSIQKRAGCHTLRHSFATRLIEDGYDIRTAQELPEPVSSSRVSRVAGRDPVLQGTARSTVRKVRASDATQQDRISDATLRDRAIFAPGCVAARSCSYGYTTLAAPCQKHKSPRSRPRGISRQVPATRT